VELVASIPSKLKLRGYDKKYILKQMMLEELNKDFLYRPKTGFAVPLDYWFRGDLKDYAQDLLLNAKSFVFNYIEPHAIRKALKNHQLGMRNFSSVIWSMLFLEHWGKIYRPAV